MVTSAQQAATVAASSIKAPILSTALHSAIDKKQGVKRKMNLDQHA
jgi:hypothetical protein